MLYKELWELWINSKSTDSLQCYMFFYDCTIRSRFHNSELLIFSYTNFVHIILHKKQQHSWWNNKTGLNQALTVIHTLWIIIKNVEIHMNQKSCGTPTEKHCVRQGLLIPCIYVKQHGMTMKLLGWYYCMTQRVPCDLIIVKTCLCMFQLAPVVISMY